MEWNLQHVLTNDEQDLLNEIETITQKIETKKDNLDQLSHKDIKNCIQLLEQLDKNQSKIYANTYLNQSLNVNDSDVNAHLKVLKNKFSTISNRLRFFTHWFKNLNQEKAQSIIQSDHLTNYTYYLKNLRKDKPYTQDEDVEKVLSIKNTSLSGFSSVYNILTNNYEYHWDGETITQEQLREKTRSQKASVRKKAYTKLLRKYKQDEDVLTEIYTTIANDWYNEGVTIRGHKNSISVRNHHNDVTHDAVDSLLTTVKEQTDIIQDYFQLKHKINTTIGNSYPNNRYHLYAPYPTDETTYSFEDSLHIVQEAYQDFHPTFHNAAKKLINKEHIDTYPKQGKKGGAFCYGISPDVTPYLLLNHTDDLSSFYTLSHEFGHAVHYELARDQTMKNYNFDTTIAETASTFSERLCYEKLLEETDDPEEQMKLIMHQLDGYYGGIYRQAYFVLFEQYAHTAIREGAGKNELKQKYKSLLEEHLPVSIPDLYENEWNYVPHIHHSPFYCYSYAWGNLATLSLIKKYNDNPSFNQNIINLLKSGGNNSTEQLMLEKTGIEINKEFWEEGFNIIRQDVNKLKQLANQHDILST